MKAPDELGLPFAEWRPGQRLAIRTALHSKTFHTVIQSPTGSGKSTITAALTRLDDRRHVTLTATKGLEDQYSRIFDFMTDIRGKGNYECLAARTQFAKLFRNRRGTVMCDDGPCFVGHSCALKDNGCLYFDAYREALAAQACLTNYHYWFAMRRFGRGLGMAQRLICDEAHALPEELMAAARIEIPVSLIDGAFPKSWQRWRNWANGKLKELAPTDATEDGRARKVKLIDSLTHLTRIDETWAWDVYDGTVVFEPTIPALLMPHLADAATCSGILYLSATITPATLTLLDIPADDVTFQIMKSRFAVARRPVYLVETVRVDHKMTADHRSFWINRIDKIIKQRLDRKGIIHTISYERARFILASSKHSGIMLAPRSAHELAATVERFRAMPPPAILLSPSVMTGWDFPYTDCEYQIIAKVPFPDTRSAIARARIAATSGYRDHLTMQALVQATGRGMRASDDQCETLIIDNHAQWFLPQADRLGLSPDWFRESVQRVKAPPSPPPPLDKERR